MLTRYTQEDVAFLLGVPVTLISKWENWQVTPSVYYLIGLEVVLHKLAGEIFPDCRDHWIKTVNQRAQELENKMSN
jgi:transcriptional regulator with XRE-family HTH domain